MANQDLITFEDLYTALIVRVKADPEDAETLTKVKEIINTRYRKICSRKKWRFLRQTDRSLTLPKKITTGTVSLTAGSRVVTGTGTNFLGSNRGWFLKPVGQDNAYRVVSVSSTTSLLLASPHTGADITAGAYKLYQAELALFPDLEDIDDVRIDGFVTPIRPTGAGQISMWRQRFPDMEGRPKYYTIEGQATFEGPILSEFVLGYDFLGSGTVRAISFFPSIPDRDYTLHVPYKLKVPTLVSPSEEPLIPINHRQCLLHYALSDWYASNDSQMAGYYQRLADIDFNDLMSKFLDTDDVLRFTPRETRHYSHNYLMRHSSQYFDTE